MIPRRALATLGWLAVACYITHGSYHVARGSSYGLVWPCNLGSLLVGLGTLLRRPGLNAVGLLWLVVGTPLWLASPLIGGTWLPTAPLTHLGGTAVGWVAAASMGLPRGSWWKATAGAMAALVGRWLWIGTESPFAATIVPGAERFFASGWIFALGVAGFYAAAFLGLERSWRRFRWRAGRESLTATGR